MRKEALIGLSVLLVAVSGSATVVDSFGVISGEASVEGPTFYLDSGKVLEPNIQDQSGWAKLNDTYTFSESKDWYDMNVNGDLYLKVDPKESVSSVSDGDTFTTNVTVEVGENSCDDSIDVEYIDGDDGGYSEYSFDCKVDASEGQINLVLEHENQDVDIHVSNSRGSNFEVKAQ